MFITRRLRQLAQLGVIVCALLVAATSGTALAVPDPLAQERYYSSYGITDTSPALAQERSYSSYGEPEPLPPPQTQAPTNDTPWLPIALSIAGALAIVAVSATQLRRVRIRRRRAAHTPA